MVLAPAFTMLSGPRVWTLALAATWSGLCGCAMVDDDSDFATVEQDLRSCNGLPPSALFGAQQDLRCLAEGPLTKHRIASCGFDTSDDRVALTYAARCALGANQSVTLDDGSAVTGSLGVWPAWRDGSCRSGGCQEWVSACLLAHVSALSTPVPVSLEASDGRVTADDAERTEYPRREAAFYGNLFSGHPTAYACAGDSVLTAVLAARLCGPGLLCRVEVTGVCLPRLIGVCSGATSTGAYAACRAGLSLFGLPTHSAVVTTFLRTGDFTLIHEVLP